MTPFSKLVAALAVSTATLAMSSAALAATSPCGAGGVYSTSGATATCAYSETGSEDSFSVLSGMSTVGVTAVGAQGGNSPFDDGPTAGLGAQVSDSALPVPAGVATLYVDVGEPSGPFPDAGHAVCGTGMCGAGGGGSADVLTSPWATAQSDNTLTGDASTDARLLVAAGGGGAGVFDNGGSAGDAAVSGAGAGGCQGGAEEGGEGGVGPIDGTPGGGGACSGQTGTAASGGSGAAAYYGGGGGGGGWFGGGGGDPPDAGGGGSSYGGAGPSTAVSITTASSVQAPGVVISWPMIATSVSYTGATSQTFGTPVMLSATLTAGGSPVGAEPVSISFGEESCQATTDPTTGVARCQVTPADSPSGGPYPITASFAGGYGYVASSDTSQSFTVKPATPVISWSAPSAISLGTTLSSAQLDATATDPNSGNPVGGTFTYTPRAGTVLGAGQQQPLSVTFTPSSGNYAQAKGQTTITVNPASPTLSNPVDDTATRAGWLGNEIPGAKAYDTASLGRLVTGIVPTGSVSYSLYGNGTCAGTAQSSQTVRLTPSGSIPTSASTAALNTSSYSYHASYSGDRNYQAAGTCQSFTVAPNQADVGVSITGPATAADSSSFSERVSVTDKGPASATNVVTALVIPSGVIVKSAGGGIDISGSLVWSAKNILPGTTVTYTVMFTVSAHARGTVAIPAAAASLSVPDPHYANNVAASVITLGSSGPATVHGASVRRTRNPLAGRRRLVTRLEQLDRRATSQRPRGARR
ncbi:MAG TPA: Ig-like domain repeat protein [Solirubrobacteraceae bacterium]|jgi:hypothetical protein|nr:Ig-like domain repeat protein [Solirubrobacteraceae bacterium]